MRPDLFLTDLEAKPEALRALAGRLDEADPWADLGSTGNPVRNVVLLGMGSSRYAAQVAARRLRARGIMAVAEYASAAELPAFPPSGTLAVAISASGNSRETLDAVAGLPNAATTSGRGSATPVRRPAESAGAPERGDSAGGGTAGERGNGNAAAGGFVALTNDPGSALAQRAGSVVLMHAGEEGGGVACRTFQHTQLLLHALAERLTGGSVKETAGLARRTAEATADLLDRRDEWLPRCLSLLDGGDGVYAIAPVERISSALQSALMVREGPRRAADGCETGDWSHVDVYLTKTLRYRALLFPGSRYDEQALEWLRSRGSTVVAVGAPVEGAAFTIRYRHDDDPDVRLTTETLVAELVAATWWQQTAL